MKIISFFILTYNRPEDLQKAMQNILFFLDRPKDIFIQIVIVNNNSTIDYSAAETFIVTHKNGEYHEIIYIKNKENRGVAEGRNQAMKKADGDILIAIDDDAEFNQEDTIQQILDLFEKYKSEQVRVLTFRINEPNINNIYIASKAKDKYDRKELFTSFFAGCGHAFDRSIFESVGYYDVEEKYGAEEYDLSYKILEHGFRIVHTNDISLLHKKSNQGRFNISKQSGITLKNKSLIAYKYLPIFFFYSHLFFWSLFYLYKTKGHFLELPKYLRMTLNARHKIKRSPVSSQTIQYIKSVGGRILY